MSRRGYVTSPGGTPHTRADVHSSSEKTSSESSCGPVSYVQENRIDDDIPSIRSNHSLPPDDRLTSDSSSDYGYGTRKPFYEENNYVENNYAWQGRGVADDETNHSGSQKFDRRFSDTTSVHSLPVKSLKIADAEPKYRATDDAENFGLPPQSSWRAFSDSSSSCSLPPYREQKSLSSDDLPPSPRRYRPCDRTELINCRVCGQLHRAGDTHLYDYHKPVDADVLCRICGQPLVDPVDARCGHTFCSRCLGLYLRSHSVCGQCGVQIVLKSCQPSSTIVQRLLDKLLVVCPNVDYCEEVLQRCDLESHLRHHCRGAVTKCPQAEQGCLFTGPRSALSSHLWECAYKTPPKGRKPVLDGHITRISVEQGHRDLGLSIVGGADTPLTCVVIQEVLIGGAVADDGRLLQGDLILEINGEDLTQAVHHKAIKLLSQRRHSCKLTVYREKAAEPPPQKTDEVFKVVFSKEKTAQLGIKLVGRRSGQGVYILSLVPGSQAVIDGQLRPEDRVIEINGHNLTHGTQEQAAFLIQKSTDLVEMVVSRVNRPETPDLIRCIGQYSNYNEVLDVKPEFSRLLSSGRCHERFITVKKETQETLGLSIAGGIGSPRGDTPIYVSNISPTGCFGRDRQLSRGDVLLSVNGTSLYGLSHTDAVTVLKSHSDMTSVSLRILTSPEPTPAQGSDNDDWHFSPSWFYWLQLPEVYQCLNVVTLARNPTGSLGFSIVGGTDSCHGSIPVYIKSIVIDTPASRDGRLRCGDMILSVNNSSLRGITHDEAVSILKLAQNSVTLTVVSWPGSLV